MEDNLLLLAKCLEAIGEQSKTNGKIKQIQYIKDMIGENADKVFLYTYDTSKVYNIGKAKIKELEALEIGEGSIEIEEIFSLLDYLDGLQGLSDSVFEVVKDFYGRIHEREIADLFLKILERNLKVGVSAKTINKAYGYNLIEMFELQAGKPIEKRVDYLGNETRFFVTEKIDGVRCAVTKSDESTKIRSRQNKLMEVSKEMKKEIEEKLPKGYLYDGELLYSGKEDYDHRERYRKTMENVDTKSGSNRLKYYLFDALPLEEFYEGKSKENYLMRRRLLLNLPEMDYIEVLPMREVSSLKEIYDMMDSLGEDTEGLMVNLNASYECKRTNSLLKVKKVEEVDLEIIGGEEGTNKYEGQLGAFLVDYKGCELKVGSGFSDEEREEYWQNLDDLIGRVITVKHSGETNNAKGGVSVRHPVFIEIREKGKEISYN